VIHVCKPVQNLDLKVNDLLAGEVTYVKTGAGRKAVKSILPTPLLFIVSHEYLVVQLIEFRVDS
jgi:hypothetical protein